MTISFSGLASGLDTTSWVESLVKLKQAKVTTLQQQKDAAVLSRDTLTSIRTFFNSFRSVLSKITDSKFNITNMDIFAQNLATSTKMSVVTANATAEAKEATYKVKVDKLATQTKAETAYKTTTTIVETTTATSDTKLTRLGVQAGEIYLVVGDVRTEISIGKNDTIATLIDKFSVYGVEASFNDNTGVFTLKLEENEQIVDDVDNPTKLKEILHLENITSGYISNKNLETTEEAWVIDAPKGETSLSELGILDGVVTFNSASGTKQITIDNGWSLEHFVGELANIDINADYDEVNGVFEFINANVVNDGTTDLINVFGLDLANTSLVCADGSNLLMDFGIEGSCEIYLHKERAETVAINVSSTETLNDLVTKLNANGVRATFEDGKLTIEDGFIECAELEAGLNLERIITGASELVGDAVLETVISTATRDSELEDIFRAMGTENYVAGGYNLVFNGQSINVSGTTSLAEIESQIEAMGGTVTIAGTGALTVTGGVLVGSVAKALGISRTGTSVSQTSTSYICASVSVDATGTTTMETLGIDTTSQTDFITTVERMTQAEAEALGYVWVTTKDQLATALRNDQSVCLGADLDLSGWSTIGGNYTGNLNGNNYTISNLSSSLLGSLRGAITIQDLTFKDCNVTDRGLIARAHYHSLNTVGTALYSRIQIVDSSIIQGGYSMTGALVGESTMSSAYDSCVIRNSEIKSDSLNVSYVAGGFVGKASADQSFENCFIVNSSISSQGKSGFLVGQQSGATVTVYSNSILNSDIGESSYILVGNKSEGDELLDVSSAHIFLDSKNYFDRDSGAVQSVTPGLGHELAIYDKDQFLIGTINVESTTNIDDIKNSLDDYGINLTLTGGIITLESSNGNFIAGSVVDQLGLTYSSSLGSTTVGATMTGSVVNYTTTIVATDSTKLSQLGITTGTVVNKNMAEKNIEQITSSNIASSSYSSFTQVTTAAELHSALSNNQNVILMNDIDMTGYNWTSISRYTEHLEGNGYSIKNLEVTSGSVFSRIQSGSVIQNLNIENLSVSSTGAAYFVGSMGGSTLNNVYVSGSITGNYYAGFNSYGDSNRLNSVFLDIDISAGSVGLLSAGNSCSVNTLVVSGTLSASNEANIFNYVYGDGGTSFYDVEIYADLNVPNCELLSNSAVSFNSNIFNNISFDYNENPHISVMAGVTQTTNAGCLNEISILNKFGEVVGKVDVNANTTLGNLKTQLSSYGITANLGSDGVMTLTSSNGNIVSGFVAEQLGITKNVSGSANRTIGQGYSSTEAVTYSYKTTATSSTTLAQLGNLPSYEIDGIITSAGVEGTVIGISSAAELKYLADLSATDNMAGKTFVLTGNIDLSQYEDWSGIKNFAGTFAGQGFTISGMKQTITGTEQGGLFDTLASSANVEYFVLKDSTITLGTTSGSRHIGFVAAVSSGEIKGVVVDSSSITGVDESSSENTGGVGGIVGTMLNGTISVCKITSATTINPTLTKRFYALGGIVGRIDTSATSADISIRYCENNISINTDARFGGGIVGCIEYLNGNDTISISNCLNNSHITASGYAGGVVGMISQLQASNTNKVTIESFVNTGSIFASTTSSTVAHFFVSGANTAQVGATSVADIQVKDAYSTFAGNREDQPAVQSEFADYFSFTKTNCESGLTYDQLIVRLDGTRFKPAQNMNKIILRDNNKYLLYEQTSEGGYIIYTVNANTTLGEIDNWSSDLSFVNGNFSGSSTLASVNNFLNNQTLYQNNIGTLSEDTRLEHLGISLTHTSTTASATNTLSLSFYDSSGNELNTVNLETKCMNSTCIVTHTQTIETLGDFMHVLSENGIETRIEDDKFYINADDDVYFSVNKSMTSISTTGTTGTSGLGNIFDVLNIDFYRSTVNGAGQTEINNLNSTISVTETTYENTSSNALTYTQQKKLSANAKLEDVFGGEDFNITVVSNGEETHLDSAVEGWTTIQDVIDCLRGYGITASVGSTGKLSVQNSEKAYIKDVSENASGVFFANSQVVDATIYSSTSESNDLYTVERTWAFNGPLNEAIGPVQLQNIYINDSEFLDNYVLEISTRDNNSIVTNVTVTFSATDTIETVMDKLAKYGIDMRKVSAGVSIYHSKCQLSSSTLADFTVGGALGEALFDGTNSYAGTNTTNALSQQKDMHEHSKLADLGVTDGKLEVYCNGVKTVIDIDAQQDVDWFVNQLENNVKDQYGYSGLAVQLINNGIIASTTSPPGELVFVKPIIEGSNIAEILGLDSSKHSNEFKQESANAVNVEKLSATLATEQLGEKTVVADETTLLSVFDDGLITSEGTLSVTVDGADYIIRIEEGDTLGVFMDTLRQVGLEASLFGGELLIQNNNKEFTFNADKSTSNIISLLGLEYSNSIEGYSASAESVTKDTSYVENIDLSVSNWVNEDTRLDALGISTGFFSIYRDGQKEQISIEANQDFGDLKTQVEKKYGEDLELTFEEGYLKISSKTGAKIEVGASNDNSNFVAITGIRSDGDKSVISARQLYCVNTESKLVEAGLFRAGDVVAGTFTIGDAEFTIDENTTLANIISQINNHEKSGAIAYWNSVDGKMVITAKDNGASLINIEAGTSNFTDRLGLTSSTWVDADGDGQLEGDEKASMTKINLNTQSLGDNASFYIDGTHFTSTSNTVDSSVTRIEGVTLELKNISEGEEIEITIKKDDESLANALSEVVDSYNTLISNIDKQMAQDSPLNNEFTLKLLRNQIRNLMTSTFANNGTFKNLAAIGITTGEAVTGNVSTEGLDRLVFDKDKFKEAYASNSVGVKELLVGTDGSTGLLNQIEKIVSDAESASGYFTSAQNSYNRQIQNITSKISRAESSVVRYRSRLESKFASMDLLISQMQNNYSSFLSA